MTDATPSPTKQPGTAGDDPDVPLRRRNPRGQGERLRDELIAAAQDLLTEAGHPDDVSIRAVARRAGVSPTAAYRHFEDRDDLVCTAVNCCFADFAADMARRTADIGDPFERLREAGRAYLDFAQGEHGRYRVLFSNPIDLDPQLKDDMAGHAAFTQLVDLIQSCLDAGAPARADATYLAFQMWTWIHGIVDLRITHPHMEWPAAEQMFADAQVALGLSPPE